MTLKLDAAAATLSTHGLSDVLHVAHTGDYHHTLLRRVLVFHYFIYVAIHFTAMYILNRFHLCRWAAG